MKFDFKPGYCGVDAMRDKAEKMTGAKAYKKGGAAMFPKETVTKSHKLSKEQSDMKMPRKKSGTKSSRKDHYGVGGAVLGKGAGYLARKYIPGKIGGVNIGDIVGGGLSAAGSFLPFKKGGKAKKYAEGGEVGVDYTAKRGGYKKRGGDMLGKPNSQSYCKDKRRENHEKKYGIGGAVLGGVASPFLAKIPKVGKYLSYAAPIAGGLLPFKEGGKVEKKSGGKMKRASGGSVYEREMAGERPSSRPHHFNYEANMNGEKPISRAMGGAGKIRHKQATSKGKPRRMAARSR